MTYKRWVGVASIFFLVSAPTLTFAEAIKIDPMLVLMTRGGADLSVAKKRGILKSTPDQTEPRVRALARFQGDLSGVEALGGRIGSVIGDIATIDLPLNAVGALSQLPNIIYVEAARQVRSRLDVSVPATGATALRGGTPPNWTGLTGKGVIVGIVDSGIDLNHADFKDPSGKSRVLFLWDQATSGKPPSGFTNGNECTKTMIDARSCSEVDPDGHGTHVAGIAAGSGSATGNGLPPFRYVGMAPQADLIVVSLDVTGSTDTAVLDGISYIQSKASALGRASVVNLSLGGDLGPHDGTSNFQRGLDNASGLGKVIVGAAGNENGANIHASGIVTQSSATTVGFTLPAGDNDEILDLWYPGADQIGISLSNGTCTTPVVNPGGASPFDTPCGMIQISSSEINPDNGDREIAVVLQRGSRPLTTGAWRAILSGIKITNGRFDGWFQFSGSSASSAQFTDHIDNSITLTDVATATQPIAVAAYTTKISWTSLAGPVRDPDPTATVGEIAPFSSLGPRRSCSRTALCPKIQKPEITAPGKWIISSLSENAPRPDPAAIDPDGVHVAHEGTSMSAPHVTGAVTLLLQAAPNATANQVKNALTTTASSDTFTKTVPNNAWGYGKLNVQAAAAALSNPPNNASSSSSGGCTMNPGRESDATWGSVILLILFFWIYKKVMKPFLA